MNITNLVKAFELNGVTGKDAYLAAYDCQHIHEEVSDSSIESYLKAVSYELTVWNLGHYES